jgi:hypothetical protein
MAMDARQRAAFLERFEAGPELLLAEPEPVIVGYDQDMWART